MKVLLTDPSKEYIIIEAVDTSKGILITKNPIGIIQRDESKNWYFYTSSNIEKEDIYEEDILKFKESLLMLYPNIEIEYVC